MVKIKNLLPGKDSSTARGVRSGVFAFFGTALTLIIGLAGVINKVPGCTDAIIAFIRDNFLLLSGSIGLSSGVTGFLFNFFFRKDVKNY